jgi:hypothetical protein
MLMHIAIAISPSRWGRMLAADSLLDRERGGKSTAEAFVQKGGLRKIADDFFGVQMLLGQGITGNVHFAPAGGKDPRKYFQGCGFARTIGAEKPDHLSLAHAQRNAVQGFK